MSFFDKIKDGASKAADKAQQTLEINRLNAQISSVRKEIDRTFNLIGQSAYQAYTRGDISSAERDIVDLSQAIVEHERMIAELEMKIREIKKEKLCGTCSTTVPLEARFCPSCGGGFDSVQQPAPVQAAVQQCRSCNEPIEPGSKFCTNCGHLTETN